MRKAFEHATTVVSLMLVVLVLYVALRPGGVLRAEFMLWREQRVRQAALADIWDELAKASSTIDTGEDPVDLVIFVDYQCRYCRQLEDMLRTTSFGMRGPRVAYRHFPIPAHTQSDSAALAAICAEQQGTFAAMHSTLFEAVDLPPSDWLSVARDAGVPDLQAFRSCLGSSEAESRLSTDLRLAETLQIRATPSLVTSKGIISGVPSSHELSALTGN